MPAQSRITDHESPPAFGSSARLFKVRGSRFKVQVHKPSEYSSPPAPPWGWSGGGLVPLWYLPIPIAYLKHSLFNQSRLSKPLSRGSSALKRFSGLDAWRWMLNMRCPRPGALMQVCSLLTLPGRAGKGWPCRASCAFSILGRVSRHEPARAGAEESAGRAGSLTRTSNIQHPTSNIERSGQATQSRR